MPELVPLETGFPKTAAPSSLISRSKLGSKVPPPGAPPPDVATVSKTGPAGSSVGNRPSLPPPPRTGPPKGPLSGMVRAGNRPEIGVGAADGRALSGQGNLMQCSLAVEEYPLGRRAPGNA